VRVEDLDKGSFGTPALRLRTENIRVAFEDRLFGDCQGHADDFVVRRNDGAPAYQLAAGGVSGATSLRSPANTVD
jgi:glutamyl-tRNA synthetase